MSEQFSELDSKITSLHTEVLALAVLSVGDEAVALLEKAAGKLEEVSELIREAEEKSNDVDV